MLEHVRVDQTACQPLAEPSHHLAKPCRSHWAAANLITYTSALRQRDELGLAGHRREPAGFPIFLGLANALLARGDEIPPDVSGLIERNEPTIQQPDLPAACTRGCEGPGRIAVNCKVGAGQSRRAMSRLRQPRATRQWLARKQRVVHAGLCPNRDVDR